jgi:hypothetical protein
MFTTSSNSIEVPHRGIPAAGDHLVRKYREQGGPAGFPEPPHSTTRLEVYGAPGPKVAAMAGTFAVEIFTSWEGFDR